MSVELWTTGGDGLYLAAGLPQRLNGSWRCFSACRRIYSWLPQSASPRERFALVAAILLRLLLAATVDADATQLGVTVSQDLWIPGASQPAREG